MHVRYGKERLSTTYKSKKEALLTCSQTPLSVPWNSKNNVGVGVSDVFEYEFTASMVISSKSSIRATGIAHCNTAVAASTAPCARNSHVDCKNMGAMQVYLRYAMINN